MWQYFEKYHSAADWGLKTKAWHSVGEEDQELTHNIVPFRKMLPIWVSVSPEDDERSQWEFIWSR